MVEQLTGRSHQLDSAAQGLVSNELHAMLRVLTRDANSDLIFHIVVPPVTDRRRSCPQSGPVAQAVQASYCRFQESSVPVELDRRLHRTTPWVNRVPARLPADRCGAGDRGGCGLCPSGVIFAICPCDHQAIDILADRRGSEADVLITPDLGNVTLTQLNRSEIIEIGRLAHCSPLT